MYAITVALNHQEIGCDPERISKIITQVNTIGIVLTFLLKQKIGKDLKEIMKILH